MTWGRYGVGLVGASQTPTSGATGSPQSSPEQGLNGRRGESSRGAIAWHAQRIAPTCHTCPFCYSRQQDIPAIAFW
eukprot:CAMPEP_0174374578 /NCGR_PEP_ID=MMETSP0811_2-20130205/111407_1 /TAXON_ID=73025 ORGANISM="Eutreptiella gymnastica-like, Strain CCMP1594" /NCGR_SAMPLE_ID=MMETSP0811_2 /ASSEMBLY_ACC=CAM_ASM_000667 /LENGTH=75 /DNA_ID=CAMNT_0015524003 /DNA_START=111 /DNA_END=335 /DNA_ORIENTATION=-